MSWREQPQFPLANENLFRDGNERGISSHKAKPLKWSIAALNSLFQCMEFMPLAQPKRRHNKWDTQGCRLPDNPRRRLLSVAVIFRIARSSILRQSSIS